MLVVLTLHFGLANISARRDFPVIDEHAHLASGTAIWHLKRFDSYIVNPPLLRTIATYSTTDDRYDWRLYFSGPGQRAEFTLAKSALDNAKLTSVHAFSVPRTIAILVSLLGPLFLIWVMWRADQYWASLVFFAYWACCPTILASSPKLLPDAGFASLSIIASIAAARYTTDQRSRNAVLAGFASGMALLTKLTWIVAFASLPFVATILIARRNQQTNRRWQLVYLLHFAAFVLSAVWTLNVGYLFEGSFLRLEEYEFCSEMLGGEGSKAARPGNRFRRTWAAGVPVPVPQSYLQGVDYLKMEVESKYWSFLNGEWKLGSWPHYYVMTTLYKTPEPTLLGALIGLGVLITGIRRKMVRPEVISMFLFLIIPAAVCFASVSLQGGFNHHHRYVLMIYPPMFALAAYIASPVGQVLLRYRLPWLGKKKRSIAVPLAFTLVTLSAVSSLRVHPYYTSYFNTLSGGPENGWRLLGFSNIDWGQDILEVDRWLKENPDKRPLVMDIDYFGMNGNLFDVPTTLPPRLASGTPIVEVRRNISETQWWIISVKKLYNLPGHKGVEYLQQIEPVEKIAYAYHVYRFDPL
ncbi:MAG TPA: hypothetical protein DDW52_02230 [Planctomycetaceae bacterium]|nr:hypothetical protein [Planctomycetaceae bacterium]